MWVAATGMDAQQLQIDVISNNLANVNAIGFKSSRADFEDLLYQTLKAPGSSANENRPLPTGIQIGHGVRVVGVSKIFTDGELHQTNNELDLAIEGNGFFQVQKSTGELAYTRAGNFKKDGEGRLVTPDGDYLQPEIIIPQNALTLTIGADGTVSITTPDQTQAQEIGTIETAMFVNPSGLNSIGKNLLMPTTASGDPITGTPGQEGFGTIAQGYLELSNVDLVEEMIQMIIGQRAYDINSKVITTNDEMLQATNNMV